MSTHSSRTAKSFKNSIVALSFYVITLLLQFFSRKIFLEYLGTEILGLNTTAMNLLQFLNLAELGINVAAGFALYKPLHDHDYQSVNEIVTLQRDLYRRIAVIIIFASIILMMFFPLIFKKIHLPLWYAYASFGVLLFSALLGYFVNYTQTVLTANQDDYKVFYGFKSVMIAKTIAQIAAVMYMPNAYVWWIILEGIFAVIASVTLAYTTKKAFPYLKPVKLPYSVLRKKYPEFTVKIKQLFFHKIGSFVLTQTSPLIIYGFTTLTVVALYGNYLIIITGLTMLLTSIYNGLNAGVGHLVTEGDTRKNLSVLYELLASQIWIGGTLCYGLWLFTPDFVTFWVGAEYILPESTLWILVVTFFINLQRLNIGAFITGFGLYQDIWAPLAEGVINVAVAIALGSFMGLNGVLIGAFTSTFIMIYCWKPYFVFRCGFHTSWVPYIIKNLKLTLIYSAVWIAVTLLFKAIPAGGSLYMNMLIELLQIFLFSGVLIVVLYISDGSTREFIRRMRNISILKRLHLKA